MNYLFTSESVSEGHPDKVADQLSDAVLDEFLAQDASSKVACETMVTTGQVVIAGEVRSKEYIDLQQIARNTINRIGYTKSEYQFDGNSCGILNAIQRRNAESISLPFRLPRRIYLNGKRFGNEVFGNQLGRQGNDLLLWRSPRHQRPLRKRRI